MKRVGGVLSAGATAGLEACDGKNLGILCCGCREAGKVSVAQDEHREKAALMLQNNNVCMSIPNSQFLLLLLLFPLGVFVPCLCLLGIYFRC